MQEYDYCIEKLMNAIETLATHSGNVKERLWYVYLDIHMLQPQDFPKDLQNRWDGIIKSLTKYGPWVNEFSGEVYQSSVENTLRRIRKSTASKIAKEIYEIYWAISSNQRYF